MYIHQFCWEELLTSEGRKVEWREIAIQVWLR